MITIISKIWILSWKVLSRLSFVIVFYFLRLRRGDNKGVVVWIPSVSFDYFLRTNFVWDLSCIRLLKAKGQLKSIAIGSDISSLSNENIVYNPGYNFNPLKLDYDGVFFPSVTAYLEDKNNKCLPNRNEIKFWENKLFMHQEFEKKKIKCPKTWMIKGIEELDLVTANDVLLKPCHSKGSIGIKQVSGSDEIKRACTELLKTNSTILVQQLLDIDRDARVVVLDGKIVMQYWRNKVSDSNEWKPTSTSHGGTVRFDEYGKDLEMFVLEEYRKLSIRVAAFDVAETRMSNGISFSILEVSPVFYPNPKEGYKSDISYNRYKLDPRYDRFFYRRVNQINMDRLEMIL